MKLLRNAVITLLIGLAANPRAARGGFDFTIINQGIIDQYGEPSVNKIPGGYRWTLLSYVQDHHETDNTRGFISVQQLDGKGANSGLPVKVAYPVISDMPAGSQPNPPPQPIVIVGPATVVMLGTTNSPIFATFRFDVNN